MGAMTEGLRSLAGPSLARWLGRSTQSALGGTLTGAATTAVIQSSSATTVAAIGFVSAGLLTFQQSLGIVYGANIGTSVTGWMVAVLGFKVDLGAIAPLFVLAGALLRFTGRGRTAALGATIAGFGLLFTGIAALQAGMMGMQERFSPSDLPGDTWTGRAILVGIGIIMTVVMQSSSAALAMALAALSAGSLTLASACALVVGMNVGTTGTALLASLGGSTAARRTGLAHLAFNLVTGLAAFTLLPVYPRALAVVDAQLGMAQPELALALFHTAFNVGGALLFLPLNSPFAAFMERVVPERKSGPTRRLERALLTQPEVALEAVAATTRELARAALRRVALDLRNPTRAAQRAEENAEESEVLLNEVKKVTAFLGDVHLPTKETRRRAAIVELYNGLDHIERLLERARASAPASHRVSTASTRVAERVRQRAVRLAGPCIRAASGLRDGGPGADVEVLRSVSEALDADAQGLREELLELAADGALDADEALAEMDEVRRVTRLGRHAYRLVWHLAQAGNSVSAATPRAVPLQAETSASD